jgi:tetratricopeptide (TPR) repeat protein
MGFQVVANQTKNKEVLQMSEKKESPQALYCRMQAEVAMQIGDFRKAKDWSERALKTDPDDAEAWNKLGWCEFNLKDPQKAIECFDNASAANSHHTMALVNKGIVLMNTGHVFDAIECYEQALKIPPGQFALNGDRKRAFHNKAVAHYIVYQAWRGRNTVPLFPPGSVYIPRSDERRGLEIHREKALQCCQEALAIDPDSQLTKILERAIKLGLPIG